MQILHKITKMCLLPCSLIAVLNAIHTCTMKKAISWMSVYFNMFFHWAGLTTVQFVIPSCPQAEPGCNDGNAYGPILVKYTYTSILFIYTYLYGYCRENHGNQAMAEQVSQVKYSKARRYCYAQKDKSCFCRRRVPTAPKNLNETRS